MAKKKHRQTPASAQSHAHKRSSAARVPLSATPPAGTRRRRREAQHRRTIWLVGGLLLGIGLLVGLFIIIANNQRLPGVIGSTDREVLNSLSQIKPEVFAAVNTGGVNNTLQPNTASEILKGPGGKPQVFYYGAEWCPVCAGTRWPLAVALSRFGTFSELPLTVSPAEPGFSALSTLSFIGSKYSSSTIDFVALEAQDREHNTAQTPTAEQSALLQQHQVTGFPFIDFGERFLVKGGSFDPNVLAGLSQKDIAAKLNDANNNVTQNIIGTANYFTAAICAITDKKPAEVCNQAPIPGLMVSLSGGASTTLQQGPVALHMPVAVFRERV